MAGLSMYSQTTTFVTSPLACLVFTGMTASAGQVPNFSAIASGSVDSLTLTASLGIGDADVGRDGNVYLAAKMRDGWLFNDGTNWVLWNNNGPLPVYSSGPLTNQSIVVVHNADMSSAAFYATQVYVGYGLNETDMQANGKYALIYTIMPLFLCCKRP